MPFFIVKNDITRMKTDAIVNAANTSLAMGAGVCGAIFYAAGVDNLTNACRQIGSVNTGEAVITEGYNLPAKYIIHTAGPKYNSGENQDDLLYSSYYNSLKLAYSNNCTSISFPLISSGVYGYPQRLAIRIAKKAIKDFISQKDMIVYLIIFDTASYNRAVRLSPRINDYIDNNFAGYKKRNNKSNSLSTYSRKKDTQSRHSARRQEHPSPVSAMPKAHSIKEEIEKDTPAHINKKPKISPKNVSSRPRMDKSLNTSLDTDYIRRKQESDMILLGDDELKEYNQKLSNPIDEFCPQPYDYVPAPDETPMFHGHSPNVYDTHASLEQMLSSLDASFSQTTIRLILEKNLDHKDIYKKANMTRQHFSKIKRNPSYIPSKSTVLALAIAMELTLSETSEYLKTSGFALSHSSIFDVIIEYHIVNKIYDIFAINDELFRYDQPLLGTKM